jgi:hypothetical protein
MTNHYDSIIFYFWLPEVELTDLYTGQHKWWFSHSSLFSIAIFYGPYIEQDKFFLNGPQRIYYFSRRWSLKSIIEYLKSNRICHSPMLSFVIESTIELDIKSIRDSGLYKYAIIGDTHHLSSPITRSLILLSETKTDLYSVSHTAHKTLFSSSLAIPQVNSPFSEIDSIRNFVSCEYDQRLPFVAYFGVTSDDHHPLRSLYASSLVRSNNDRIHFFPRMHINDWLSQLSKVPAVITCSLNGLPSYQTYAPLLFGTCLITDPLSPYSRLGKFLEHGHNCLIYKSLKELNDLIDLIYSKPGKIKEIGLNGHELIGNIVSSRQDCLQLFGSDLISHPYKYDFSARSFTATISYLGLTVAYIYEVVQELHRLTNWLDIYIYSDNPACKLSDALRILPRINIKQFNSRAILSIRASSSILLAIKTSENQDNIAPATLNCTILLSLPINIDFATNPKLFSKLKPVGLERALHNPNNFSISEQFVPDFFQISYIDPIQFSSSAS